MACNSPYLNNYSIATLEVSFISEHKLNLNESRHLTVRNVSCWFVSSFIFARFLMYMLLLNVVMTER
jgi:hypothetical protein